MGRIWPIYGPYMGPRPVWCGRVGGCGGNTRDFGEHATKGGNKRDFGKHATKVGTLKEFRKKDANFAIFCATEGGNKRDFCEHARKGGQKRDFGEHGISGNKRDLYPRPVWCGGVGVCGGNTRDFGEHATKTGNKRDFGKICNQRWEKA